MTDKNKDCRKQKRTNELKDGQIASLEEARKKDQGKGSLPSSHPTSRKDTFYSDNQYLGSKSPLFVELLDIAEEVLRDNTDIQACMNEAADLVALVAKLKEEHSKELEERDMKHGAELSKLMEQITNLNGSLDAIAKQNKEQHAQLREAEEKLAIHLDDMAALHDHVLGKPSFFVRNAACNLSDRKSVV